MKSHFSIFGLERTPALEIDDEKSGQPYVFRKYPKQYDTVADAQKELEDIMSGNSPFIHFKFTRYVILEIYSQYAHDHPNLKS